MGKEVAAQSYTREERQRYREKVHQDLDVFERMLAEAHFEAERPLTGLEIELNLIDDAFDPAFANAEVLEAIDDPDFQTELAQFNIELNVAPRPLPGDSALALEGDLRHHLNEAEERARGVGARIVPSARHHQRMGHARPVGGQPRLLGHQVALHPARAGRIALWCPPAGAEIGRAHV